MKTVLLLCLFLSNIVLLTQAQTETIARIEIDFKDAVSNPSYYVFGEHGIVQKHIDRETQRSNRKEHIVTFTKYNNALEKEKTITVKSPRKQQFSVTDTSHNKIFELAYDRNRNYTLHTINIETMSLSKMSGKLPKKFFISEIHALNHLVFLVGRVKRTPIIILFNTNTKKQEILTIPISSRKFFRIESANIDREADEFIIFTYDNIAKQDVLKMFVFKDGRKTQEFTIPQDKEQRYIQEPSATKLEDKSYIITGTYKANRRARVSNGIIIIKAENSKIVFARYINYLDINNFTSYLRNRVQNRIEKKRERREKRGQDLELNYFIASHKIREYNNTYTLVGEAFYPTYRTECRTVTTSSGTRQECTTVFDGYEYTHYFIYCFDNQGNHIWSNSKPMHLHYKPMRVYRFLRLHYSDNYLTAVHASGTKIYHHTYKDGEEVSSKTSTFIETEDDDDKIRRSSAQAQYWYNNYFIAHGFQRIRNKEERETRRVYYLNKIKINSEE